MTLLISQVPVVIILDVLPEWSTATSEDMDYLGTFDATGAFLSLKVSAKL